MTFDNGTYRPGDFWTFPARTATGTVEWPPCDSDGSPAQPPASLIVHEAPLAVLYRPARTTKESAEHDPVAIENCRRSFHPQTVATAIHVTGISWVNDDVMTLDQLAAKGLTITLDQVLSDPVTGAHYITGANFIVTLESVAELPEGSSATLRQIVIVDAATNLSEPESGTTAISWLLNQPALGSIEGFVSSGATQGVFARVRVKLLGQTIFASGASGPMYLDGCAFGLPAVRRDGSTPRVDLHLPSGAGVAASDFDGWFYLVPALQLSLSIAYPQLVVIVNEFNTVTGVATPQNPTTPVIPTATVTLNSAPAEDTEVSLTLSGQAGVSIPSSVSIGAGNVSQQFNITTTALNNPGANVTLPFTIVASVSSTAPQASATFTVAGVPNPETH